MTTTSAHQPRFNPKVKTYSGMVSVLFPTIQDVCWRDIAIQLGRIYRFNGASLLPFSVAQHSVMASELMERAFTSKAAELSLLEALPMDETEGLEDLLCKGRNHDDLKRQIILAVTIHDAHEAHIGDQTNPVIESIHHLAGCDVINQIKCAHDQVIYAAAKLAWPLPSSWCAAIRACDTLMLATETRDIFTDQKGFDHLPRPASLTVKPVSSDLATNLFIARLQALGVTP